MTPRTLTLKSLEPSETAEIVRIDEPHASQLAGFGLFPGVVVLLRQKFPSYVVKTEETELALESQVAARIHIVKKTPA